MVEHPQKRSQIRRFMNYYLPTTLKVPQRLRQHGRRWRVRHHIDGTMGKIETMMDTVTKAFDKQLDALFGDEAWISPPTSPLWSRFWPQEGSA